MRIDRRNSTILTILFVVVASEVTVAQDPDATPGYAGMTVNAQDFAGLRVVEVDRGGPAERGGIRVGDLLLAINSRPLNHVQDLVAILQASKVGTKLEVIVAREGRRLHMRMTLGKRPAIQSRAPLLGLRTIKVTPELRAQYKLPTSTGAFVEKVTRDSPADEAGIPAHVLVAKINGRMVSSPEDLQRWVKAAGPSGFVELIYYDQGRLRKTSLTLADHGTTAGIVAKPNERPVAPSPRPRRPATPSLPTSDRQRIRMLEQRIEELERRIEVLESRHTESR